MKYKINQLLRSQAFYLIKKYTSYRLLKKVYQLNKDFIDAFEYLLRHPPVDILNSVFNDKEQYEQELLMYLYVLDCQEKSLNALTALSSKREAYSCFFEEGGVKSTIFGRYGDEHGLTNDIFYHYLGLGSGYGDLYSVNNHTAYIEKILIASLIGGLIATTLYEVSYSIPNQHEPIYKKWSYESLFGKNYWPPLREIVEPIIPCPPYNKNTKGEIESGEEIQITGIYEPWFEQPVYEKLTHDPDYNPYVGCPNYFLADSIAIRYKLEGTNQEYEVKWRLIWEDQRYLDGKIPAEEQAYSFDLAHIVEKS